MTNPVLSNNIATDSVILWQYDKAYNLIRLINSWNEFAIASCTDFWNHFGNNIFAIDRADTYGLNVWGNLLGIPRPMIKIKAGADVEDGGVDYVTIPDSEDSSSDESSSDTDEFDAYGYNKDGYRVSWVDDTDEPSWKIVTIKNTLYRGLLKGRFFLMCHSPTVPNYNKYLAIVFGATGDGNTTYDIFDEDGNIKDGFSSRCNALDFQNMSMGFTFPQNATIEESYLIFQHYDVVFPFPAGIRYPGAFVDDSLVIGMNKIQTEGQFYKNFVDGLVLAEDTDDSDSDVNPNGGIFSTTVGANYLRSPVVSGKAFVIQASTSTQPTLSFTVNGTVKVWIDWGDGECGYRNLSGSGTAVEVQKKSTYAFAGLVAVTVFYKDGVTDVSLTDETPIEEHILS